MPRRNSKREGFTLIEFVAALALSALLMVGLLNIISSIVKSQSEERDARTVKPNALAIDMVADLIYHDLVHATQFEYETNQLSLTGLGGIDPVSGDPTHRLVEVRYELLAAGGKSWLVRTQTEHDNPSDQNTSRRLLLEGVNAILALTPEALNQTNEMPDQVSISIARDSDPKPWLQKTYLLTIPSTTAAPQ